MTPFTYLAPESLDEALDLLARHGDEAKLIAGGTALVNFMKQQLVQAEFVIGLRRISALEGISRVDGATHIGALTTLNSIETSPVVADHALLLVQACHHVATIRIRSVATIGGAVCYADPNLDTPPALIALDARIMIKSPRGEREVQAQKFFLSIYETVVEPDEIVTAIVIPTEPFGSGVAYMKFVPATQDDYPTVTVAARLSIADGVIGDARVALGAVGTIPVRAEVVENALRGATVGEQTFRDAAALIAEAVSPIADFRGSAEYKRDMAVVHVRRALSKAAAHAAVSNRVPQGSSA